MPDESVLRCDGWTAAVPRPALPRADPDPVLRTPIRPRHATALARPSVSPSNPWQASVAVQPACHDAPTPAAAQLGLKASPAQAVCATCHGGGEASVCAHRPDIVVTSDRVTTIAEPLRPALSNGQVVCTTCHDMTPHCALDVKSRYRNKSFLRGGPFEERGEQCFLCHEESAYRKPSPHMQSGKDSMPSCPMMKGDGETAPISPK